MDIIEDNKCIDDLIRSSTVRVVRQGRRASIMRLERPIRELILLHRPAQQ